MDLVSQQGESTMNTSEASEHMCISSLKVGGMKKGFRQVTKSIIGGRSKLVIMSKEINEKKMLAIIEGLVKQYDVPVLQVKNHNELARYVGICKTDETGKIIKDAKCAVASIEDFGESTEGREVLFGKIGLTE
ncbi:small subunit ribosomal protein S12e [Nematocida minor]|uniref:small subunit ribosomal protein S12e n=1 Tax=Nematocida minor TaxID=1912983 RepID=UPI00221EA8EB|nr:small subunit ribosomal protein S12e [Nematocida minor]KAI5192739.1 small subunit ribosomal protein S12e [Nematocida minor]